jgi:hypothetical protein
VGTAKNILILALVVFLLFFVLGDSKYIGRAADNPIVVTKIDSFYKHDTIIKYKKGSSIPFVVLDTIYKIDQVHDTAYIVNDYNKVKAYSDTLRINTDNSVYIQDTITQNRIIGRSYKAHLTEKTIVVTNDIYHKPKNELYIGLLGDIRRFDNMIGVGVGLNYKKQKEAYTLSFTTNQISLGLYKKLF